MEESQLRSLSSPVFPQGLVALENLLRSRFGVEVGVDGGRIVPLDSYWDKNFLVEGLWEGKVQKFNLKLMNGFDSRNRPLFGFQKQLVDRLQAELGGETVLFPVPVASKEQEWTVFEDMPVEDGSSAPIATRLLRWVEGEQTLREAFETCAPEELPALMEQAGFLFGRAHATLCGMNAWELEAGRVPFIWSMREFPSAEPYVSVLAEKDEGLSQSCQRVFDLFRERVEPSIPFLREGPVMGDFNDANVILTSEGPGAIDFGDSRLELVVGDAAIATAYMLTSPFVQSQKASPDGWHEHLTLGSLMETVRPFVAGMVQGGLSLTETEKSVFPLFVLSRMVQSVVLGCDSVDSAPENEEYLSIHTPIFSRLIPVLLEAYERGEFSPASILGETPSLVYYVTGNENKAKELNALLSENEKLASTLVIKRKDIDLDEIQGSSEEIATDKASRGAQILRAPVIVEDVSLCFDALNGLPGPYIKWFIKQLGTDGIYDMISRYEDRTTRARCTMAYEPFAPPSQEMKEEEPSSPSSAVVVVGEVEGTAVAPRGDRAFGWDPLFMPQGFDRTFSEMDKAEKNSISHRKRAVSLLMDHLVEAFHL